MFTYSKASQGARDGSPVGNVYFGRFSSFEKKAYLAGRLTIKRDECEQDLQDKRHNGLRRFGGFCEACSKTF